MPKVPTQIKIGPHTYRVVRKSAKEMGEQLGDCEPNDNVIILRSRLRLGKAQEILLHEIQHACTYPTLWGKTLEDEEFIDGIAPVLLQVMQDNPQLMEFLTFKKV